MIILQANDVARYFGSEKLFDHLTFNIQHNDRLALVGKNGSGKSTLLKIIAGLETPDQGSVSVGKDIQVGFLAQRTGLISDKTIWEEMLTVFEDVMALGKEIRETEKLISTEEIINDPHLYEQTSSKYDRLQQEFADRNGYGYENEIRAILHGFRFYEEDYDRNILELSGGQKTRLALAKLLLEKPNLLILDEPTNHLDVDTLTWLEGYLKGYNGALLIVSHDRYFLDELVNKIYDLSFGNLELYHGNYSKYLSEKQARLEKHEKAYEKQQKEISETEKFIEKNITRASTTKRAQSRRKQLEKLDRIQKPQADDKSAKFRFSPERMSGDLVLQVQEATIGYEGEPTASHINLDVKKGEIIALVGPNGVGKSTLLKTIVKHIPPISGEVIVGTKVDMGYYDQEQFNLHHNKTILNELWDDHPTMPEQTIRSLLGGFLFSGDDVKKNIASLSGGEKSRVALAKLALNKDNFLILDEPTNHLDIDSKEVLEEALVDFDGTILFVSHDRYFINNMADKIIELNAEGTTLFLGDYDYYTEKKKEFDELKELKALEAAEQGNHSQSAETEIELEGANLDRQSLKEFQKIERRLTRELDDLEEKMKHINSEIKRIEEQLVQPEVYNNPKKAHELSEKLASYNTHHEQLTNDWIEKGIKIENLNIENH